MASVTVFDYTLNLDVTSDVSIDVSAGHSYTSSTNNPWNLSIYVDGVTNNSRGGAGAATDAISCIGAANQLAAGQHQVTVYWYGSSSMTLFGAVLRILVTKR